MNPIILTSTQRQQIEAEGVAAYPNECCGIFYGRDEQGRRVVEKLEPVVNSFEEGERYHRFSITPATLMAAEKSCAPGQLVLGFYHSHPDHPARPSEYDRVHGWPFYSYVIVAIHEQKPERMTSWVLSEQSEQFEEQPIAG